MKIPYDLAEAADIRAKRLGYSSWNAYVLGLIEYDLTVQGEHVLSLNWAKYSPEDRDNLHSRMLDMTRKGQGERGELLAHILDGTSRVLKRNQKKEGETEE